MKLSLAIGTVLWFLYLSLFSYNPVHEAAISYNIKSGEIHLYDAGPHLSAPWELVTTVDIRPQRVCITSVAKITNCKLARFVPSQYQKLIEKEGFRYYWWDNRISFNAGYKEEYRGFSDVMRGYVFGTETLPLFIEVMEK